ncbi:MAG TPA: V-type ATPase 116kDa subunit family protein, partial [Candidatus Norongarragalinales archaeon]|nr:V-type ATPase 116kDa subunit family protein [Candidatus Norongarragalinales archaeon]
MFFPEPMTKVRVLCAKKSSEKAVQALYDFGLIHIVPSKAFQPGQPSSSFRNFSEKLVNLRSLCAALKIAPSGSGVLTEEDLASEWQVQDIEEALSWLRKSSELEANKDDAKEKLAHLSPFRNLEIPARLLQSSRIKTIYFQPKPSWHADLLRNVPHECITVHDEGATYLLLITDARHEDLTPKLLPHAERILEFQKDVDFRKSYEKALVDLEHAKAAWVSTRALLERYRLRHQKKLSVLLGSLENSAKQAELPLRFGQSEQLCAVEGWVPTKNLPSFSDAVSNRLGSPVVIETLKTSETPPTKLNNPRPIRPFEFLIQALSTPKYHELDPTILVFLSFPLFFGMILGDIGYGITMALIALFVRSKFPSGFFRTLGNLMILSAFWTIVFGYVFGEFLGAESILGIPLYPLIHRLEGEGLTHLMQLSLLFGFVHLALGYALGAYIAHRENHQKHAVAKVGWLAFLVSLAAYLSAETNIEALDVFSPIASILGSSWIYGVFLSILVLLFSEGLFALFEIPSVLGNLVSYLRIMA